VKGLVPWLVASLVIAAAGFVAPTLPQNPIHPGAGVFASVWLGAAWALLFSVAVVRFRKRGLWLLAGAPFALLQPCIWGLIYYECDIMHHLNACP
jgi:hypothetical protein